MQMLTKPESQKETNFALMGEDWDLLNQQPIYDHSQEQNPQEIRIALRQAEIVIRAQEHRIHTLEAMALTDELTGLYNRRGFTAAFKRELALARRDAECCGILVMIDLDAFKTINDQWGHQAGDAYLCTVADVLRESVRLSDTVARLGGDEFALLLPHVDVQTGIKCLDRIEHAFHKRALVLQERIPLRASFGYAPYTGADNAETVMQTADVRLYAHKARHRKIIPVIS